MNIFKLFSKKHPVAEMPHETQKIGLALGGGSLRGWAHVGVLKVLEEINFRPDYITGTSMGAIIGAAWAGGVSAAQLEEVVCTFKAKQARQLFGDVNVRSAGIVKGDGALDFLRPLMKDTFEELEIPFASISCDMRTGNRIVSSSGNLLEALRESFSLPVIFTPVERDGMLLVDGGLVEPVPVFAAQEMGASYVIAVPLNKIYKRDVLEPVATDSSAPKRRRSIIADKLQVANTVSDISGLALAKLSCKEAQLIIRPNTDEYTQFDYTRGAEIIKAGEDAARMQLSTLKSLVDAKISAT